MSDAKKITEYKPLFFYEDCWKICDQSIREVVENTLLNFGFKLPELNNQLNMEWTEIPFYKDAYLLKVSGLSSPTEYDAYFVVSSNWDRLTYLDGTSPPIHWLNNNCHLTLQDSNIEQYLQFFCFFVQGDRGSFHAINSIDHPSLDGKPEAKQALIDAQGECIRVKNYHPILKPLEDSEPGFSFWKFDTTVFYGGVFFETTFLIEPNGFIEMAEDEYFAGSEDTEPHRTFPQLPEQRGKPSSRVSNTKAKKDIPIEIIDYDELQSEKQVAAIDNQKNYDRYLKELKKRNNQFYIKALCGGLTALRNIVATLKNEFPHMHEPIDFIANTMFFNVMFKDSAVKIPPILLSGPPGTGKSRFIQRVAELLLLPKRTIDFATVSAAFVMAGASRVWKSGQPGLVADTILNTGFANPLIAIEELDKSCGRDQFTAINTLYTLLEPGSARDFVDEFLNVKLDCRHINWIASCNSIESLSSPILSRFKHFHIPAPESTAKLKLANTLYGALLEELDVTQFFCSHLSKDVSAVIAQKGQDLREMRLLIHQGLINATTRYGRLWDHGNVELKDIRITLMDIQGEPTNTRNHTPGLGLVH